jgi:hypothetical protein
MAFKLALPLLPLQLRSVFQPKGRGQPASIRMTRVLGGEYISFRFSKSTHIDVSYQDVPGFCNQTRAANTRCSEGIRYINLNRPFLSDRSTISLDGFSWRERLKIRNQAPGVGQPTAVRG